MLDRLDLLDAEIDWLFSEVIDAHHEDGAAAGLKLPRCRTHEYQRAFLA